MADIYIKKEDLGKVDLFFDLEVVNSDIVRDDSILTATIISIFTDGSKKQISELIDDKKLGNEEYSLSRLSDENIRKYEKGLEKSLKWLIEDELAEKITATCKKQGNRLNTIINIRLNDRTEHNIIYNTDNNMEILDDY